MQTPPTPAVPAARSFNVRLLRWFLAATLLLMLVQGFLAGMLTLSNEPDVETYRALHAANGHVLELFALVCCISAFVAKDKVAGFAMLGVTLLVSLQNGLITASGATRALHAFDAFLIVATTTFVFATRTPWRKD